MSDAVGLRCRWRAGQVRVTSAVPKAPAGAGDAPLPGRALYLSAACGVAFLDSSGINSFVAAHQHAAGAQGGCSSSAPSPPCCASCRRSRCRPLHAWRTCTTAGLPTAISTPPNWPACSDGSGLRQLTDGQPDHRRRATPGAPPRPPQHRRLRPDRHPRSLRQPHPPLHRDLRRTPEPHRARVRHHHHRLPGRPLVRVRPAAGGSRHRARSGTTAPGLRRAPRRCPDRLQHRPGPPHPGRGRAHPGQGDRPGRRLRQDLRTCLGRGDGAGSGGRTPAGSALRQPSVRTRPRGGPGPHHPPAGHPAPGPRPRHDAPGPAPRRTWSPSTPTVVSP